MMYHLRYLLAFLLCVYLLPWPDFFSPGANENKLPAFDVMLAEPGENQAVIPGDFADPSIVRVKDTYYATGTSSEWAPHFPIFKSLDLIHWEQVGYVLNQTPAWAASSFWAPEIFYHNNRFYIYYVAKKKSDGISCIGVATSDNPEKGFTDRGILLEYGKEAIDAFVFQDQDSLYITWKAYGLDDRPIELLASTLSNEGLKVEGKPFSLLIDLQRKGMEGQSLVKRDGYYYLFYSEGGCCGRSCSYNVSVARATSIRGPFTKYETTLLSDNDTWKCPGHGTLVEANDGRDFFMYHAYRKTDHVFTGRQALIDEIVWEDNGWPRFKTARTSSIETKDDPRVRAKYSIADDFSNAKLSKFWQWDFRNAQPEIKFLEKNICLSGTIGQGNKTGTVLTVRPYYGDYEVTTAVVNRNHSLKGLVVYGDVGDAVGIGALDDRIQLWQIRKGERIVLGESPALGKKQIQLKIKVENGSQMKFFWGDETRWNRLSPSGGEDIDGSFLPAWDRSPRPGLIHFGRKDEPGCFSFFKVDYK